MLPSISDILCSLHNKRASPPPQQKKLEVVITD